MIARAGVRRIPAITFRPSHLLPYRGSHAAKLPGDGAPPIEPPPALKERIMAVVHAESRAATAPEGAVTLPASVSSSAAPGAAADVTISAAGTWLRVRGLPAPPPGGAYRVWLLHGAAPRVPQPGPLLQLDAEGRADLELTTLGGAHELAVALEGAAGPAFAAPVLRVLLPPGVAARDGR